MVIATYESWHLYGYSLGTMTGHVYLYNIVNKDSFGYSVNILYRILEISFTCPGLQIYCNQFKYKECKVGLV